MLIGFILLDPRKYEAYQKYCTNKGREKRIKQTGATKRKGSLDITPTIDLSLTKIKIKMKRYKINNMIYVNRNINCQHHHNPTQIHQ